MSPEARGESVSMTTRAIWLMAAKTLAMAFGILLPLFLVRHMTQEEFGLYKQAFLVVATAYSVLPLGFGLSAFYFFPRESERKRGIVLHILLFHVAVGSAAAGLLALEPEIVSRLFQHSALEPYAEEIGLVILLLCASTFLEFVAIANQETRLAAVLIGLLQMTKALVLIVAALVWGTIASLLTAAAVHGALQLTVLLVYLSSRFRGFWQSFDGRLFATQLAYALPYGAAALLWFVRLDLHHYFVAHRFSAAEYAIYAVGCFQLPLLGILRESVGSVMIPRVSELQKEGRRREILDLLARGSRRLAGVYLPVAAAAILFAPEIISLLFTDRYLESAAIFRVNAVLIPLATVAITADAVIRAYAEHKYYVLKLRAILTVFLVAGLYTLVERFGLLGAIGAVAGFELLERGFLAAKTGAILHVSRGDLGQFADLGKILVASLLAVSCAAPLRAVLAGAPVAVVLAVGGAVFAAVYGISLLLLKVPTSEELDSVRRQGGRLRRSLVSGAGRSKSPVLRSRSETTEGA